MANPIKLQYATESGADYLETFLSLSEARERVIELLSSVTPGENVNDWVICDKVQMRSSKGGYFAVRVLDSCEVAK